MKGDAPEGSPRYSRSDLCRHSSCCTRNSCRQAEFDDVLRTCNCRGSGNQERCDLQSQVGRCQSLPHRYLLRDGQESILTLWNAGVGAARCTKRIRLQPRRDQLVFRYDGYRTDPSKVPHLGQLLQGAERHALCTRHISEAVTGRKQHRPLVPLLKEENAETRSAAETRTSSLYDAWIERPDPAALGAWRIVTFSPDRGEG